MPAAFGPGKIVVKYRMGMKILPVGDRGGPHGRNLPPGEVPKAG
jgi:hypothetical protein